MKNIWQPFYVHEKKFTTALNNFLCIYMVYLYGCVDMYNWKEVKKVKICSL